MVSPLRRSHLRDRVLRLCDDVVAIDPALAEAANGVRATIDQALRLAVVGTVKAGKSTLVNALIGDRVAPTSAAECTKVVTWYRYGSPPSAELVLRDGTTRPLPFNGSLPDELGAPVSEISHVVVSLQAAALRDFILIDTPGLSTTTDELEDATRRAILGGDAVRQADALIYVFRSTARQDDVAFLKAFQDASGGQDTHAAGSIGVLSHADDLGSGAWGASDPIEIAREVASTMSEKRRGELSIVVPLAGRMAEAAVTGEVRERDAATLAKLADLDEEHIQLVEAAHLPVDGIDDDELRRTDELFHGYVMRHGRETARSGALTLTAWMRERSGMTELDAALRTRYRGRYSMLKAAQGIATLRAAANGSRFRRHILDVIGEATLDDGLHPLAELAAWEELRVAHPNSDELRELDRLLAYTDDRELLDLPAGSAADDVRRAALAAATRAQGVSNVVGSAALATAGRVLARSYLVISREWESPD